MPTMRRMRHRLLCMCRASAGMQWSATGKHCMFSRAPRAFDLAFAVPQLGRCPPFTHARPRSHRTLLSRVPRPVRPQPQQIIMPDIFSTLVARDLKGLMAIIKSGADVNEVGAGEQTPLHLASELDAADCVSALLSAGADVKVEDGQLRSPLLLACESNSMNAAKNLLFAGASLSTRDKGDFTPLHWLAQHGSKEMLQLALDKGAEVDAVNDASQTPLGVAISRGHVACALALLDGGASARTVDEERRTPLHLATQYGAGTGGAVAVTGAGDTNAHPDETLALLRKLLDAKADVNATDRDSRTPLHWSAGKNNAACVGVLLAAGASAEALDWAGHSPMHWSCTFDAVECARALHAAGGRADGVDRDKRTPLHWAADKSSERCLAFLLSEGKVAVDATDRCGYTALHSAARRGSIACIKLLLDAGANRAIIAIDGETPADIAADDESRAALVPAGGLKRKRSLSSNSVALEGTLPTLAEKFYSVACELRARARNATEREPQITRALSPMRPAITLPPSSPSCSRA